MTIGALARGHGVRSVQGEVDRIVVERGRRPPCRGVALLAGLREVRSDVVGVRSPLEILQVTRDTSRTGEVVVIVAVAVSALPRRHTVKAGQRKASRRVIKLGV